MQLFAKPMIDLMHKVESPSHRIMMFTVPMRSIRVIATDESLKTFRVEQLVFTNKDVNNPLGSWNTLSTHGGQQPGEAWQVAAMHALDAQKTLRRKLDARRKKLLVPA